jgi:hypothetical protein
MRGENEKIQSQLARTLADMDNLRKRTAREKEDTRKFAARQLIEALLPRSTRSSRRWRLSIWGTIRKRSRKAFRQSTNFFIRL